MPDVTEDLQAAADQEQEPEAPDYGDKFLDLPQERIDQLQSLVNKLNLRDQWARQIEICRCTLKRYFWLGLQHVWWNNDLSMFQVGQQGGSTLENRNDEQGTAMQDFNIYKPNGKIFCATFAQNPATVRMEPDQPKDAGSIRAAAEAEKYTKVYDKWNPPQDAQIRIGQLLWNDGRVVAVTEWDEKSQTEKTEYLGVLESKVPIYETDVAMWYGCKASKEHDILAMKSKHPEVADKLVNGAKSGTPNDEIARMARISTAECITQLSHDTLQYLVTEDRWWLRPCAFNDMTEADRAFWLGGQTKNEGSEGKTEPGVFPDGCKLTFCGQVFCGAEACSMDEHIDVMHAEPGQGQARNSLGDPHVPVQMEFNDAMNLTVELLKFTVPSLWADLDDTEFAAIQEQLAQYGQIRPKKAKDGQPLTNSFFPEPTVEAPAFLGDWLENLQGPLTQLTTGNQPALFGAQMEDQKTAKGYQLALNQSLGLLTIIWVPYSTFASSVRMKAAKIAANRPDKFAAMVEGQRGKKDVLEIDPQVLKGGFTYSAISDQSFPESWAMRSQTYRQLLQLAPTNPVLAETLQLPDNLREMRDYIGLPGLVIPGEDPGIKQLEEWGEIMKGEGPEPDQQATQQKMMQYQQLSQQIPGLPPPQPVMKSSVEIDPETDDHVPEAMECFRILNSPDGQKIKRTQDLGDGRNGLAIWTDLKLHMLSHVAAGQKKGLVFPPPLGGPPPMPAPGLPGKPPMGAGGPPGTGPGAGAPPLPGPGVPGAPQ